MCRLPRCSQLADWALECSLPAGIDTGYLTASGCMTLTCCLNWRKMSIFLVNALASLCVMPRFVQAYVLCQGVCFWYLDWITKRRILARSNHGCAVSCTSCQTPATTTAATLCAGKLVDGQPCLSKTLSYQCKPNLAYNALCCLQALSCYSQVQQGKEPIASR